MKVEKKDLAKSQIELTIELSLEEFSPYIAKGAEQVSRDVKIEGFRPGKVPLDILRQKIGEMTILEEAANIAINKTIGGAIKNNISKELVGQPQVNITKLAPNNPLEYKVILALLPEIQFGDYKNAKVKIKKIQFEEAEIDKILSDLREMRVKEVLIDREIKDGDKVIVDIKMFLDKIPVEGGQGKDTAVIIGKNYIIPGFDKKLLGAKKEEIREFELPYPDDFHMKNLAGKIVEFRVTIKDIFERTLPALDEKFAAGFGLKKMDELRDGIKKSVLTQKQKEADQQAEKEMIEKILAKSRFADLPEILVSEEAKTMLAELEHSIEDQGAKFDDYLASMHKTADQLTLDLLPEAVKRVKISLLIREVAALEKIAATEEEAEKHIQEIKKYYSSQTQSQKPEILKKISAPEYKSYVVNVLSSRKVIDKLREWNIETQ